MNPGIPFAYRSMLAISALLPLAACTNTGAIMIGPDTYQVSTRVALSGSSGAQGGALQTANEYCQSQGRQILLQQSAASECALHGGCGQSTVTFYCLKPGDSQLQRPTAIAEPTSRVQIVR